jgi:hypothetical protein
LALPWATRRPRDLAVFPEHVGLAHDFGSLIVPWLIVEPEQ